MDEVIFFRQPGDASRFLLFNLPRPPHPLAVDETSLTDLCSQYGFLYKCTLRQTFRESDGDAEHNEQPVVVKPEPPNDTSAPPIALAPASSASTVVPPPPSDDREPVTAAPSVEVASQ